MRLALSQLVNERCVLGMRGTELVRLSPSPRDGLTHADSRKESLIDPDPGWAQQLSAAPPIDPARVRFLPPVLQPGKILCVGRNYCEHAKEMDADIPTEPLIFSKLNSALIGHRDPIMLPPESLQVDYEAELVVIIGRRGHRIPQSEALTYVAGYTCGHDVSARDWQKGKPGGQWLLGKSFDTFAPLGPWLVTPDEIPDPGNLEIELRLNGRTMQHSSTRHLIFSIPDLISYISQVCTLEPGDLIFTGTPDGVGAARKPPVFLQPGDHVEVVIEQLGTLANPVQGH